MARIQYTPYTRAGGYKPQQVDDRNLARMREESQRQLQGMRENATAEINNRKEIAQQMKADQAYTKAAEEKNFQIQTDNARREAAGLARKQQQAQQQFVADQNATKQIFDSISSLSTSAAKVARTIQESTDKQKEADERADIAKNGVDGAEDRQRRSQEFSLDAADVQINANININDAKGGDPLAGSKLRQALPGQNYRLSKAKLHEITTTERSRNLDAIIARETAGGRIKTVEDLYRVIDSFDRQWYNLPEYQGVNPKLYADGILEAEKYNASLIARQRSLDFKVNTENAVSKAESIIQLGVNKDLNANVLSSFNTLSGLLGNAKALDRIEDALNVRKQDGSFKYSLDEVRNVQLTYDGKLVTLADKWPNRIFDITKKRVQLDMQERLQQLKLDDLAFQEELDRGLKALGTDYTEDQVEELRQTLWTKFHRTDSRVETSAKKFTIESRLRAAEAERIAALPDYALTDNDLIAYKEIAPPSDYAALKQRKDSYDGKWRSKDAEAAVKRGLNVITGTTALGTSKAAQPGAAPALRYFEAQALKNAKVMEGAMGGALPALEKAVADESSRYLSSYRDPTSVYYRKVEKNGSVSYPNLPGAQNISAADAALRDISNMRVKVKEAGNAEAALRIPNLVMSDARMDQVAQNYGKPGFLPNAKEMAFKGMTSGMPLHEVYNQAFAAAGRKERFASPLQNVGIQVPPHLQKVLNDPAASRVSKMNAVNVASGNTEIYSRPSAVRAGSPLKRSFTGALTYADNKETYVNVGNAIQQIGFTVTEHPDFGGVAPGVHSANSYHGYGEAMDIILKRGTRAEDIQNIARLKELIRSMDLFEEVIGPGDGDPNHEAHLHAGGLKRPITQQDLAILQSFWGR